MRSISLHFEEKKKKKRNNFQSFLLNSHHILRTNRGFLRFYLLLLYYNTVAHYSVISGSISSPSFTITGWTGEPGEFETARTRRLTKLFSSFFSFSILKSRARKIMSVTHGVRSWDVCVPRIVRVDVLQDTVSSKTNVTFSSWQLFDNRGSSHNSAP